ncbi:MAG: HRDC domain-containing protein [Gammaproteobacteria bacterium]|jgi:ribonuclease D
MKRMIETDLFIDTDRKLAEFLEETSAEPLLALDTEFVREKTYYPKLCLIQIATPVLTICIDCLAPMDLAPLFTALFTNDRTWILHSARQDLEVMYLQDNRSPVNLIDTQIAAALLGYAPQIGLQALLAEELGVELEKEHTRADWSRRPLPDGALQYALDDVRYLLPLWRKLEQRLNELQRGQWLNSDCRVALDIPPLTPPVALWSRLRGLQSMEPLQQCAALAMVGWRERRAQSLDRPRRWIMSDELLTRIARRLPQDQESLQSIPEIPRRLADHSGGEILAELQNCGGTDQSALIEKHLPLERPDKTVLQTLRERVRVRAEELGIQSEVLATRKEMSEFLVGRPSDRISAGWRQEELESLLG